MSFGGLLLATLTSFLLIPLSAVFAAEPQFEAESLNANYYLARDSKNVAVLAVEEVFIIRFPTSGNSFTGFHRSIPTRYLDHDIELEISGVTDTNGTAVPYHTQKDADHNLVVIIGNPAITVYGQQSYILKYQSRGVVNFFDDRQEFYPNFNGRGWSQSFGSISGTIHLSNDLAGQLKSPLECFIDSGECAIASEKRQNETLFTAKSQNLLSAGQSLSAKLTFSPATFEPLKKNTALDWIKNLGLFAAAVIGLLALAAGVRTILTIIWRIKN